jgi:hypothetical protein
MPAYGIADSASEISPGSAFLLFLSFMHIFAPVYEFSYGCGSSGVMQCEEF